MDFNPNLSSPASLRLERTSRKGLQEIIQLISNVTEAFTAALFLYNSSRDRLTLTCYHSLSLNINPETEMQVGDSLIGWVAKNKRPVNIAQFDRDTRNLRLYRRDEGIKAFLAVPVGEEGVLCVDSKRNYIFTEKHQKILQDFSLIILMALEMEGVSQREKRQTRILDFLYQINDLSREGHPLPDYYLKVLKRCREFSNTDAAFIALVPKKGDRYKVVASEGKLRAPLKKTHLGVDMGLTGWVIREEKPLIRPVMKPRQHTSYVFFPEDPCRHFQSYMGLPLHFFRKVYGVMNLIGYQENHWEEDEIRALLFAGQIITTTILSLMDN